MIGREALRLFREREEFKELQRNELRRSIKVGTDDLDAGRSRPFDAAALDQVKGAGRRRVKQPK